MLPLLVLFTSNKVLCHIEFDACFDLLTHFSL